MEAINFTLYGVRGVQSRNHPTFFDANKFLNHSIHP